MIGNEHWLGVSMADDPLALLADGLREERPVVLFVGQAFDKSKTRDDTILSMFFKRLGIEGHGASWKDVFARPIGQFELRQNGLCPARVGHVQ